MLEVFSPLYDKLFYFPGDKKNYLPTDGEYSHIHKKWFQNSLGNQISIWHLTVKNPIGRVIHCHGSGDNISSHYPHVSWLTSYGYEVIMFDYPGYGESGGTPTRESTVATAGEVIEHFTQQVDPLPVFILGQSLGGNIASVALTDIKKLPQIRGVILDSMYSSFKSLGAVKIKRKYIKQSMYLLKLVASFISDSNSPLSRAELLNYPTLILHSRNDKFVPYQESLNFYNQMTGEDVEFWSHLNSCHTDVLQNNISDYPKKVVQWMRKKM